MRILKKVLAMNQFVKSTILSLATLVLIFSVANNLSAQKYPPENLGDKVNTPSPEVNPVLSISGDTLFFSRIDYPENRYGAHDTQDIYMSVRDKSGRWGEAVRLNDSINLTRYNAIYGVLEDGKTYLISGVFDKQGKRWLRRGFSFIKNDGGRWGIPQAIRMPGILGLNEADVANATITKDGRYIIMAVSPWYFSNNLRLYVSERKGEFKYSRPKRLKGPIKGLKSLEAPILSPDQKRLYFSARKKGGSLARRDVYYLTRKDSTSMRAWDSLALLSDTINDGAWNSYFRAYDEGANALFCSNREGGQGMSDLWGAKMIEVKPWVQIQGKILDSRTGKLIDIEKNPRVKVNGQPSDSIVMNPQEATFFAIMPFGNKYAFTADLPYFTSDTVILDVTDQQDYMETSVEIMATPVPYVNLGGKMINSLTLMPIPAKDKPYILIDGKKVDSLNVDAQSGTFDVNLPWGRKYNIQLMADDYSPIPKEVDLTKYDEYQEVKQDLFAKPNNANMVTLSGRVINTKSGQPLAPDLDVKMRVNGVLSPTFTYDAKKAFYTFMLPAGSDYDLVPLVPNFYNKLEVVDLSSAKPMSKLTRNFFVTPLEVGQSVDIENIYFETGKSVLKPESFRSLNALVDFFKEYPNVKVEIGGHTDNTGSLALNKRLSQARAQAVAEYLISKGIARDRFQTKGWGPDKPKASNKTAKGRQMNRRVDFTIMGI